jgi:hypothetical protein
MVPMLSFPSADIAQSPPLPVLETLETLRKTDPEAR